MGKLEEQETISGHRVSPRHPRERNRVNLITKEDTFSVMMFLFVKVSERYIFLALFRSRMPLALLIGVYHSIFSASE